MYSELKGKALPKIIEEISKVKFLQNIVIGLDQANREQFEDAKRFFSNLPQRHEILWNDGPGLRKLDSKLAEQNLAPQEMGKGRNVWYCMGYILALGDTEAIALHDCDIMTYNKKLLARLVYPVANLDLTLISVKVIIQEYQIKSKRKGGKTFSDSPLKSFRKNNRL